MLVYLFIADNTDSR